MFVIFRPPLMQLFELFELLVLGSQAVSRRKSTARCVLDYILKISYVEMFSKSSIAFRSLNFFE